MPSEYDRYEVWGLVKDEYLDQLTDENFPQFSRESRLETELKILESRSMLTLALRLKGLNDDVIDDLISSHSRKVRFFLENPGIMLQVGEFDVFEKTLCDLSPLELFKLDKMVYDSLWELTAQLN